MWSQSSDSDFTKTTCVLRPSLWKQDFLQPRILWQASFCTEGNRSVTVSLLFPILSVPCCAFVYFHHVCALGSQEAMSYRGSVSLRCVTSVPVICAPPARLLSFAAAHFSQLCSRYPFYRLNRWCRLTAVEPDSKVFVEVQQHKRIKSTLHPKATFFFFYISNPAQSEDSQPDASLHQCASMR